MRWVKPCGSCVTSRGRTDAGRAGGTALAAWHWATWRLQDHSVTHFQGTAFSFNPVFILTNKKTQLNPCIL